MLRRRRGDALAEVNLLELTPTRLAQWEEDRSRVVVLRPPPRTTGLRRRVDGLLHAMSVSRIRLDEVGSFVWLHLDGEHTVAQVVELLRAQFGAAVEPAGERLAKLIWLLHRQELIEYSNIDT